MSPVEVGLTGVACMVALFFFRMPIAFAMMLVGLAGVIYLDGPQAAFYTLARDIFDDFSSYPLSVVTTFVFMGPLPLLPAWEPDYTGPPMSGSAIWAAV